MRETRRKTGQGFYALLKGMGIVILSVLCFLVYLGVIIVLVRLVVG